MAFCGRRAERGQSLIEFAFLAPVMMLLIVGMIDLGRGFYYQTEITDAARDAARVLIAPSSSGATTGPGVSEVCSEAERDLSNIGVTNVTCLQVTTAPPFSFTQPSALQATVLVYCGTSADCSSAPGTGTATTCDNQNSPHTCIAVGVAYSFAILSVQIQQIGGPSLLLDNSAEMVTLW